ncbi:MAG TPA: hypothetical protein VK886_20065, partial [Vicinamibacterales bacterium]|nr:hypothetical protein [Vicinamibacterales bacterium]
VPATAEAAADPRADGSENVRLVGHHDLQGRESLVVTTRSDAANGNWVYVGHHESLDSQPKQNPVTGKAEFNGTSILEITDPATPRLVWHIPNQVSANSRGVWVVYDYKFNSNPAGRDYLIRNSEAGDDLKFQIFDITSRHTDPSQISLVSEITGTPVDSCGRGCGGKFIQRAHKGWWSEETGYFYSAAGEPGFRSTIVQIFDLKDPKNPKFVGRLWLPGQKEGEPGFEGQYAHHPIPDEQNKRLYVGYRNAGGQAASFDISNPAAPKLVWSIDMNPPHRGPHTVSPIVYDDLPNFGKGALPRTYAFIVDEAGGAADMAPCANPVRAKSYMLDITHETRPFPVSVWEVPVGNYCSKGGRFGPHQSAETVNGTLNRFENKLAWIAYFNAGIRVVDLSDPYHLKEVGYYVPKTNQNSRPIAKGQPVAIQINDVDIDHRGLAYASDRVGAGLFVLEYTGSRRQGT